MHVVFPLLTGTLIVESDHILFALSPKFSDNSVPQSPWWLPWFTWYLVTLIPVECCLKAQHESIWAQALNTTQLPFGMISLWSSSIASPCSTAMFSEVLYFSKAEIVHVSDVSVGARFSYLILPVWWFLCHSPCKSRKVQMLTSKIHKLDLRGSFSALWSKLNSVQCWHI